MPATPEDKALEKTKIQLMRIRGNTFYTTILFSLKQSWNTSIDTAATNGTHLYINIPFFLALSESERIGLLAHEIMHVALSHMTRKGDRHPMIWNIAADYIINLSLTEAGYTLPSGALYDTRFTDMSTEQVYNILIEEAEEDKANGGAGADGMLIPGGEDIQYPGISEEIDVIEKAVAGIVKKAQIIAEASNDMPGNLPGELEIHLQEVLNPVLPWNVLLQNYLSGFAKDDYTWKRANRRYMPTYYLPSAYSEALGCIATAVDVSGSVADYEFSHFIAEHAVIQETLKPEKITVISFDTKINSIQTITPETDVMSELKFHGRGGTDVTEVLKWAIENEPMVLLIFTDGEFYMPDEELHPTCPVIWLIHDSTHFTAPFGEVIFYNIEG